MRLFLLRMYFYFFRRTDSLECCIKQPQSYLKNQKIEIKFVLKILFYAVFIRRLHLFKSSRREIFCKSFAKFTEKHLRRSLIQNNVAGCCFCSLSGIYKRQILTHVPAFPFYFLSQCSDLPFENFVLYLHCDLDIRSVFRNLLNI